jgi:stage II sporulation protein D
MVKKQFRYCLMAVFFIALAALSCGGPRVAEKPPPSTVEPLGPKPLTAYGRAPQVRVLILEAVKTVRVRVPSAFLIGESQDESVFMRTETGGEFVVRTDGGEVELIESRGGTVHKAPMISIRHRSDKNTYINGNPYRGGFVFVPSHGGVIAINILEVDDYIKGVLPAEIGYLTAERYEAYRAQAIASRSYALSKLEEKRGELFDLKATIMDQVYRGVKGEHPEATRAVEETRGHVAVWNGEPAKTYYCACCGGHTADIRVSWPWKTPYPFLYGQRDAPPEEPSKSFCRGSAHFRWRVYWSGATLERIIRETLPAELGIRSAAVGRLEDIKVAGTAPDGRVTSLEIITDRGTHRVDGDRIRWVLRPKSGTGEILKSTMFKMSVKKARGRVSSVNLVGGGNGHGIGLCQAGAMKMAEMGYRADEILAHYYPGAEIRSMYR